MSVTEKENGEVITKDGFVNLEAQNILRPLPRMRGHSIQLMKTHDDLNDIKV